MTFNVFGGTLNPAQSNPQQIEFKLAVLVFRCQFGTAPSYLTRELRHVADMDSRRQLKLGIPPMHCITVSDRAFGVTAADIWNGLPSEVITLPLLTVIKQWLKTLHFSHSFDVCMTLLILLFLFYEVSWKFFLTLWHSNSIHL